MLIDIHCHIDFYKPEEIKAMIERARTADVGIILNNSINPEIDKKCFELKASYPEVQIALGSYPIDCLKLSKKEINEQIENIKKNKDKITAIGEVGLDLKESDDIEAQKKNLLLFINLAKELDKPIIIHSRKAEEEAINILEENKVKKVLMHCFNGNLKQVKRIIDNKWYLSIPTNVTYLEHFQKVIELTPIEQLFCESDSPFLHPVKGERNNESSNIIYSYKKIAEIKKLDIKEVERIIENNYNGLFG